MQLQNIGQKGAINETILYFDHRTYIAISCKGLYMLMIINCHMKVTYVSKTYSMYQQKTSEYNVVWEIHRLGQKHVSYILANTLLK